MRARKDLEAALENASPLDDIEYEVLTEVLLDIRDLLMELVKQ